MAAKIEKTTDLATAVDVIISALTPNDNGEVAADMETVLSLLSALPALVPNAESVRVNVDLPRKWSVTVDGTDYDFDRLITYRKVEDVGDWLDYFESYAGGVRIQRAGAGSDNKANARAKLAKAMRDGTIDRRSSMSDVFREMRIIASKRFGGAESLYKTEAHILAACLTDAATDVANAKGIDPTVEAERFAKVKEHDKVKANAEERLAGIRDDATKIIATRKAAVATIDVSDIDV